MLTECERSAKNAYGNVMGYGECPNCGDSWSWKPCTRGVEYTPGRGVSICDECLARPKLDIERIARELRRYEWPPSDVQLVVACLNSAGARPYD